MPGYRRRANKVFRKGRRNRGIVMKILNPLEQKFIVAIDDEILTIGKMRERAGASYGTGSPITNSLENRGLLKSRKSGRKKFVKLTRRGRTLCKVLKELN